VEISKPKGLALGIDSGNVFERVTADERITLSSGDCVLLFTDGVKEALDASEEEFGLDRLSDTFRDAAQLGAEAVVKQVQEVVKSFTGNGPQMDDVTIVAIEKR
jgi:sigma-B regulation protein RsbU (phosphoserine phosphatase)